MSEDNDVKALENISTEVDEIQLNILLSTQCLKVQNLLVDKLKKQSERQKEVCSFINSANLKIKTEIKLAELEFNSLTSALQTIQSANVEYRKELLLLKERRLEVEERVSNGIRKYENLWMQSKNKYECIPLIKTYFEAKNKCRVVQETISILKNEYDKLSVCKKNKNIDMKVLEKHHILQLAEYLIYERPKSIQIIIEQEHAKNKLENEIQNILQKCPVKDESLNKINTSPRNEKKTIENTNSTWEIIQSNKECSLMLPKIQLQNSELDVLSMKLNEIKKVDDSKSIPKTYYMAAQMCNKKPKTDDISLNKCCISDYFNIRVKVDNDVDDNKNKYYSGKRLIHILEDIKLDRKETSNVVAQINCNNLQSIDVIKAASNKENDLVKTSQSNLAEAKHSRIIEEINSTSKYSPTAVLPPTQFMDLTQENHFEISNQSQTGLEEASNKLSQEKKEVQFDMEITQDSKQKSQNTYLNTSTENLHKMKEMFLKKHNLDLSPQFVYTKNTYKPKTNKDQFSTKENVTSKFFDERGSKSVENNEIYNSTLSDPNKKERKDETENTISNPMASDYKQNTEMEKSSTVIQKCSSPKDGQDMTVAGLLFHHGPQSIPDSLNLSVSAEYEEGDSDFIHGIDSNLLLSPKPDMPTIDENNNEPCTEGINNFLSGLRKTGLSLFGSKPTDSKGDANSTNLGNNFTFSFGDGKRNKGGLFSMFH